MTRTSSSPRMPHDLSVTGAQGEAALSVLSSSAAALSPTATSDPSSSASSLLLSCDECDSAALSSYSSTYRELRSLHTSAVRVLMRDSDRWNAAQQSVWQTGRVMLLSKLPLPAHCALFIKATDRRVEATTTAAHTNSEQTHSNRQSQSAAQPAALVAPPQPLRRRRRRQFTDTSRPVCVLRLCARSICLPVRVGLPVCSGTARYC